MDSGAELYRQFLGGDNNALVSLIDIYKESLSLYINTFVNDICLSEELMEETFVHLVAKKPVYLGKSAFRTWIFAIGRNVALDYMRKIKRRRENSIDDAYSISDKEDLERSYIRKEQNIILYHALSTLNPDYSQVIHLTFLEGFSNSETAEIMNKSNRQIENLLFRAKKALKTALEKEGFNYENY